MDSTSDAPGWDAIDSALDRLYPGIEPYHLATLLKWRLGGPDPLDGVSVYNRDDHWHYVTYGLSELYEKESDEADVSGWGFELTFRPTRAAGAEVPPVWASNLLQNLARYVFGTGNVFGSGHYMTLNGPIDLGRPGTAIRHVAFCSDPELDSIDTPHGTVAFLQVVGLTDAEYEAAQAWSTISLLDTFRTRLPLLTTDPDRSSLLDSPDVARIVADRTARDGSSATSCYVTQLAWRLDPATTTLTLGALSAPKIATALRGRLPFDRDYTVFDDDGEVRFLPGEELTVAEVDDRTLSVTVPGPLVEPLLAALVDRSGVTTVDPRLTVEIVPTEIKNDEGAVVNVIG